MINRAYQALDDSTAASGGIEKVLAADPVLRNATRFALKCGEHTWVRRKRLLVLCAGIFVNLMSCSEEDKTRQDSRFSNGRFVHVFVRAFAG